MSISEDPVDIRCCNCGAPLTIEGQVFFTSRGICHVVCPAPDDPYDWCKKRPGETAETHRARMLANVPTGLKRNVVSKDPAAIYLGVRTMGGDDV